MVYSPNITYKSGFNQKMILDFENLQKFKMLLPTKFKKNRELIIFLFSSFRDFENKVKISLIPKNTFSYKRIRMITIYILGFHGISSALSS